MNGTNSLGRVVVATIAGTLLFAACRGSTKNAASSAIATVSPSASEAGPKAAATTEGSLFAASEWAGDSTNTSPARAGESAQVFTSTAVPDFQHQAPLDDIVATALVDLDSY